MNVTLIQFLSNLNMILFIDENDYVSLIPVSNQIVKQKFIYLILDKCTFNLQRFK